jgi:hypothetical protein
MTDEIRRLRSHTALALIRAGASKATPALPDALQDQAVHAQRAFVRVEGPKAAAWLVWIARRSLHAFGAVDYHFKPGDKEPRYFLYAIALLKMRVRDWRVEVREEEDGGKSYRVTWKRWHTHGVTWRAEKERRRRQSRNARKRAQKAWFDR